MRAILITFICASLLTLRAQEEAVRPVRGHKIEYFPLSDVKLLDSPFKDIQDKTHRYLLTLEPDRLCAWFRREAGLEPKAQPYPNWESGIDGKNNLVIPGHILGFYLSSMAMMYATTGDPEIVKRLEYTLQQLDECQDAAGDGFLGANPDLRKVYDKLLAGEAQIGLFNIAEAHEPIYIMNKITLGLYGVFVECKLPLARKVLIRYADWFGHNILDRMDDEALQRTLATEHGSISESFINVYRLTGEKKYMEWALRLNDRSVLIPLAGHRDILADLHANCNIQKNSGFASVYKYTGDEVFGKAAWFFWNTVAEDHTWIFGGNSSVEHFFPKSELDGRVVQNGGPESCNSVNMLRLTEYLYQDDPGPEMIDYYERTLVNHLLGAYEPERGMIAYMTKVNSGAYKIHGTEYGSFWCCTGTGMESPAKFQKMIYAYDDRAIYVNMFIPSTVMWKDKGVSIRQTTDIPDEERSVLEFKLDRPAKFALKIRHPYWVRDRAVRIEINGKMQKIASVRSGFISIERKWKDGDRVSVHLPMHLEVTPLTPAQKFVSFSYGPVVLAAEINSDDVSKGDYWDKYDIWGRRDSGVPLERISPLGGKVNEIAARTVKISGSPLTFVVEAQSETYKLMPLNRIHYSRYLLYFPCRE
jgi:DUF1680 family protein